MARRLIAALAALVGAALTLPAAADPPPPAPGAVRVATFNAALSRSRAGALVQELRIGGSAQVDAVAEIIQRVRPDILLINEIDHDPRGVAIGLFAATLEVGRGSAEGIVYRHRFTAPSNTGEPIGFDLDGDGRDDGPRDAHGYGLHRGHFGMAVLSRFALGPARTFALTRWADMPDNRLPSGHFPPEAEAALRLSSKSHWDLAAATPLGAIHLLASHPTPPVFDGPEDTNGRRNADEMRFWIDYLDGAEWIADDAGARGGAGPAPVVVLGDLNGDPDRGDGIRAAIRRLLSHPRLRDPQPAGTDGPDLATALFRGVGALRVDYVLPDRALRVTGRGVFWPEKGDPLRRLVGEGDPVVSSDHRLVWVDVAAP